MKTIKLKGIELNIVEHMKEIPSVCINSHLFARWHSKKQFFEYILGRYEFDYSHDDSYDGMPKKYKPEGSIVCTDPDWYIQVYRVDKMDKNALIEFVSDKLESKCGFFIIDYSGIYAVYTDED